MFTRSKNKIDECPICLMNNFEEVACLNCFHTFCIACIRSWLQKDISCPICRREVTSVQTVIPKKRCSRFRVDQSYIRVERPILAVEPMILPLIPEFEPEVSPDRIQESAFLSEIEEESMPVLARIAPEYREYPFDWRNFIPSLREIESYELPPAMIDNRIVSLPDSVSLIQVEGRIQIEQNVSYEPDIIEDALQFMRDFEEIRNSLHLRAMSYQYNSQEQ